MDNQDTQAGGVLAVTYLCVLQIYRRSFHKELLAMRAVPSLGRSILGRLGWRSLAARGVAFAASTSFPQDRRGSRGVVSTPLWGL